MKRLSLISSVLLTIIMLVCAGCTNEQTIREVPWTGEDPPPPPSPGTRWIIPENSSPKPEPESAPIPSPKYNWEIIELTYKVTEKNPSWWKFAWQTTLKNNTSSKVDFFINVNFLDREGFIVDDDIENPPIFNPKEHRTIRGFALIDSDIASTVHDIEIEITAYIED